MKDLPFVSMVVIGYNEADNLDRTFSAINKMDYPKGKLELIYVDSGSNDGSREIAKKYTDKIFIEDAWPTAARNRNRGLMESSNDIVHFIDGDIEIAPAYLAYAVKLIMEGKADGVFGKLEERNINDFGKILLHDYSNRKTGYIDAPGAGGTFRRAALVQAGGWDERIPRGEETEIGHRLHQHGFKIWFTEEKMGIHDFGVNTLFDFLKKQIADGVSYGRISNIPSGEPFYTGARRLIKNNITFHVAFLLIVLCSVFFWSIWPLVLFVGLFNLFLFFKYFIIRGIKNPDSLKYFFLSNNSRIFVFYGYVKFLSKFYRLSPSQKKASMERMALMEEIRQTNSVVLQ